MKTTGATFKKSLRALARGDARVHLLTKIFALAWLGVLGVLGGSYAGVRAAAPASAALLAYNGGIFSPVSVFGIVTVFWVLVDWRMGTSLRNRQNATIIRDKPALANDPRALSRERKVRQKELKLQRREEKALRAENRAERKLAKDGRKENAIERKREQIQMKKEELRQRENLGR